MARKITNFFREFIIVFSIILIVIGAIVTFIGASGIWFRETPKELLGLSDDFLEWSLYLLIVGFIALAFGIYYLYKYVKNRKFILEELETNKRSEFLKKHSELRNVVRHMPSRYQKMLKEKEKELNIK
jgi:hypothetical protein